MKSRAAHIGGKVIGLAAVCFAGALIAYSVTGIILKKSSPAVAKEQPTATTTTSELRFAAMGDMLAHDSIRTSAQTSTGYDFTKYFSSIRPLYKDSDVVFCNPETLVSGESFGLSGYPSFNAPTEFARDLMSSKGAGCNLINLATNHLNDKGQAAIDKTVQVWQDLKPLAYAGANRSVAERDTVRYFTKNGIKVAFAAFMDFSNKSLSNDYGVETYHDEALVRTKLTEARKNADLVIVSAHWGTEDSTTVNEDQKKAAQLFSSLGADIVIGTGPHVIQAVETIPRDQGRNTTVLYSIGNMLSSQLQLNELTGMIATFTVIKQASGITVEKVQALPTFMSYDWSAADRAAQVLDTRSNFQLQPLADADKNVTKMFPQESTKTRLQFVKTTLGSAISVDDTSRY